MTISEFVTLGIDDSIWLLRKREVMPILRLRINKINVAQEQE